MSERQELAFGGMVDGFIAADLLGERLRVLLDTVPDVGPRGVPARRQNIGKPTECVAKLTEEFVGITEFPTPLFDVVTNCITIRGSFVGNGRDMAAALAFAADDKVQADIELQPLSAIDSVCDQIGRGDVPSRMAHDFSKQ